MSLVLHFSLGHWVPLASGIPPEPPIATSLPRLHLNLLSFPHPYTCQRRSQVSTSFATDLSLTAALSGKPRRFEKNQERRVKKVNFSQFLTVYRLLQWLNLTAKLLSAGCLIQALIAIAEWYLLRCACCDCMHSCGTAVLLLNDLFELQNDTQSVYTYRPL